MNMVKVVRSDCCSSDPTERKDRPGVENGGQGTIGFHINVATTQGPAFPAPRREPTPYVEDTKDHRSDCIREALQCRGLSSSTADIIISSWRQGTRKQYGLAWRKWFVWNNIRFGDPFQASEIIVLQYLQYLFNISKSYSVINTHKAMLLQTLPFFGNKWCKQDSGLISRFMKGIFVHKPPKPRYMFTWDVTHVLTYLSSLFPLDKLSLKLLTMKTVALVALATAPRAQTLVSMNLDHMLKRENSVIFMFPNLLKTSRVGHSFSLNVEHFQDERLCAMHTLLYYLRKTRSLRKSNKVFVSYVTYNAVCTSTIARWLKVILALSGIDVTHFKAHSYRSASVSAAYSKGASLKCILDTADWKSDKNFRKFYFREALSNKNLSFANAVLKL